MKGNDASGGANVTITHGRSSGIAGYQGRGGVGRDVASGWRGGAGRRQTGKVLEAFRGASGLGRLWSRERHPSWLQLIKPCRASKTVRSAIIKSIKMPLTPLTAVLRQQSPEFGGGGTFQPSSGGGVPLFLNSVPLSSPHGAWDAFWSLAASPHPLEHKDNCPSILTLRKGKKEYKCEAHL